MAREWALPEARDDTSNIGFERDERERRMQVRTTPFDASAKFDTCEFLVRLEWDGQAEAIA